MLIAKALLSKTLKLRSIRPDKSKEVNWIVNVLEKDLGIVSGNINRGNFDETLKQMNSRFEISQDLFTKILNSQKQKYSIICQKLSKTNSVLETKKITSLNPKCPTGFKKI